MYVPRTPYFSEFSYGFAVARELVEAAGHTIKVAPVFPSLVDEAALGWDLLLNTAGKPLFVQFKLSDYMKRGNANERTDFDPPYYRFHLRCAKELNQHSLLVDLNNGGEDVRYVAPAFYLSEQLTEAWNLRQVVDRSIQIRPSEIGDLTCGRHHVTFQGATGPWLHYSEGGRSKPRSATSARKILADLEAESRTRPRAPIRQELQRLDAELTEVFARRKDERSDFRQISTADIQTRMRPLDRIDFIVRYFLDCQLFFAMQQ